MTAGKILVFIPAYNEERSISSVVLLAKKYGRVCVIDDGSDDKTALLARAAGARVVRHKANRGYGAALKSIFEECRKADADAFVVLDGDMQHDPDEIPIVARPVLDKRADVSLGSRYLGRFVSPGLFRKAGVFAVNFLASMRKRGKRMDSQCGFRAYSRKAVRQIDVHGKGYGAGAEIIFCAQQKGLGIVEVPVSVRYYKEKTGGAAAQGVGLASYLIGEIVTHNPDAALFASGALSCILSAALGIFVVVRFYERGVLPTGSALLTVFLGIAGILMVVSSIILRALNARANGANRRG